jgi:hypothetical protein
MFRRGNIIGMEIDDKGLVAVSLKRSGRLIFVSNSARMDFDLGQDSLDHLSKDLKNWAAEFGAQGSQVSLAVSGSDVYHQVFSVPVMSHAELARVIDRRIEKEYPFPEGDLIYDYSVLGETSERGSRHLLVLVVVLRKSFVYKLINLFQKAELSVYRIVTRPLAHLALVGEARAVDKDEQAASVSIGHGMVSVNFLTGDRLQFCRDTSMVTSSRDPHAGEAEEPSTEFYVRLEREIKRSIDWYKRQPHGDSVQKLIVFDYGKDPEMPKYLTGMLGVEVEEFDSTKHLNIQLSSKAEVDSLGSLETALGCALGGGILDTINLLPPEFGQQREAIERRLSTIVVLAAIGVILAGGYMLLGMAEEHYTRAVMNQRSELFRLRHYSSQHKEFLDERTMLEEKVYSLQHFTRDRIDWGSLFSRIGSHVPEHTIITDLLVTKTNRPTSGDNGYEADLDWTIAMEGLVAGLDPVSTQAELAVLLEGLESSGWVEDMRFEFLRESESALDTGGEGFQITARIKNENFEVAGK